MIALKTAGSVAQKYAQSLQCALTGRPLVFPSLGSMTLDTESVHLAREWLHKKACWQQGSVVARYEKEFARWNGSKYAFAFMGGRVALSACIYALGLQPGDEVILPGYTCVVVPNAFHYAGITTVYADIELETYGLDINAVEQKMTARTRAILLHHLYGLVCRDYEAILALAKRKNVHVIEDCAHATGALYRGRAVGNRGDVAFFSSEQSKVFTTIQGGIAITNNDTLAEKMARYAAQAPYPDADRIEKLLYNVIINYYRFKHPQRWFTADLMTLLYHNKRLISTTKEEEQGIQPAHYGQKMPDPVAALGCQQLQTIDHYNERRRDTARRWDAWCQEHGYPQPRVIADSVPVYLRYPVLVEKPKKRDLSWAVRELGVSPGVWFVSHVHPAAWRVEGCPNADRAVEQCINFPCLLD